jgi:hypothetical protein
MALCRWRKSSVRQPWRFLVFPGVTKAGLGIGGQYGEGTLLEARRGSGLLQDHGRVVGLQAGAQNYGYAMFFMNANAVTQLDNAKGFEVGVGPTVVVVDEGMGKSATTTTLKNDIYAFNLRAEGPHGRHWHPGQQGSPRSRHRNSRGGTAALRLGWSGIQVATRSAVFGRFARRGRKVRGTMRSEASSDITRVVLSVVVIGVLIVGSLWTLLPFHQRPDVGHDHHDRHLAGALRLEQLTGRRSLAAGS